ncbi:MAG: tetratricopeptide repeat protein [Candidatus Melainabacteria bacterium]|nr:tetratricopeptide repeat protein [Candidatus Melainabacteria bacterium]
MANKNILNSKVVLTLSIALSLSSFLSTPARTGQEEAAAKPKGMEEYRAGIEAYGKKDYKSAETHFRKCIEQGNKQPGAWLYAAHTFLALGQYAQAKQTYEMVTTMFKKSPEAEIAEKGLESVNAKIAGGGAPAQAPKTNAKPEAKAAGNSDEVTLLDRITIVPPKMGHPAVSSASLKAVREGLNGLPVHIRKQLIEADAKFNISPNMIDRWPESADDLNEESEALNLAELPGRLYGTDCYIYERPKARGSMALKAARSPQEMKHTALNECFQVLDDKFKICKDPKLMTIYRAEADGIPETYSEKLATFTKEGDWGIRETCSELSAGMFGAAGENDSDLNRFFPRTKKWLRAKLGI